MIAYDRILETFENIRTHRIKSIGRVNEVSFTRNRKMPFEDLTTFILAKKGKTTTTMELNNYFKELKKRENTVSKQAFSKQRQNLNPEVFNELNKDYVKHIYEYAEIKKYKGYLVTAIDGTSIEIPNTKELQEEYDCQCTGQSIHRTIARALASGIYDVENNIMIDTIIGKRTAGERDLAKKNIDAMLNILGKISVRMVKITLSTGEIEYLVTNIDKSTMCTKEFGELYYKRWGIMLISA